MSSLFIGPNSVRPWIGTAVEACLVGSNKKKNPPPEGGPASEDDDNDDDRNNHCKEGAPRLAQVIHQDGISARLSDGQVSIAAVLSGDVRVSLVADSFSVGCIVRVRGWSVTTQKSISRTATHLADTAAATAVATTGDGVCLWVPQRLEIIGGSGLAKVGDPMDVHSHIPIRRILMSLHWDWEAFREHLKASKESAVPGNIHGVLPVAGTPTANPVAITSKRVVPLGNTAAFLGFDGAGSTIPAVNTTYEVQDLFAEVLAAAAADKSKQTEQSEEEEEQRHEQRVQLQQSSQQSQREPSQLSQDSDSGPNLMGISAMLEPMSASDNEDDPPAAAHDREPISSPPAASQHSQVQFETQPLMEQPDMEDESLFETQQPMLSQERMLETQPPVQDPLVQAAECVEPIEDSNQLQSQAVSEATASSMPDEPEFFTQNMDLLNETNASSQQFNVDESSTAEQTTAAEAIMQGTTQKSDDEKDHKQINTVHETRSEDTATKSPLRYPLESGLVTHRRGSTGGLPSRFSRIPNRRGSTGVTCSVETVHDLNLDVTLGSLPPKRKKRSWGNVKGSGIERLLSRCGFFPAPKKMRMDLPSLTGDRIRKMLDT